MRLIAVQYVELCFEDHVNENLIKKQKKRFEEMFEHDFQAEGPLN